MRSKNEKNRRFLCFKPIYSHKMQHPGCSERCKEMVEWLRFYIFQKDVYKFLYVIGVNVAVAVNIHALGDFAFQ